MFQQLRHTAQVNVCYFIHHRLNLLHVILYDHTHDMDCKNKCYNAAIILTLFN